MIDISWLVVSTPLKNMKVSWDHYSQHMESHKIHVPKHQPVRVDYVTQLPVCIPIVPISHLGVHPMETSSLRRTNLMLTSRLLSAHQRESRNTGFLWDEMDIVIMFAI